jgi:hypothetical protein
MSKQRRKERKEELMNELINQSIRKKLKSNKGFSNSSSVKFDCVWCHSRDAESAVR